MQFSKKLILHWILLWTRIGNDKWIPNNTYGYTFKRKRKFESLCNQQNEIRHLSILVCAAI